MIVPQRTIRVGDHTIRLTETQFHIATAFLMNIGRIITRDHLRNLVRGVRLDSFFRQVDTHVSQLRDRLLLDARHGCSC
jgi:two-component system response regulator RegX3